MEVFAPKAKKKYLNWQMRHANVSSRAAADRTIETTDLSIYKRKVPYFPVFKSNILSTARLTINFNNTGISEPCHVWTTIK